MCSEERARLRADAGTSRLIVFVWRLLICAPCDPPDGPSLQTWDPSRLNLVPTLSLQQLGDCWSQFPLSRAVLVLGLLVA